jgi:serine/threonine protein kinase
MQPENILLTKNGEAKICDFGFATLVGDRKTLCGTYEYMAPEMIQNHTYGH